MTFPRPILAASCWAVLVSSKDSTKAPGQRGRAVVVGSNDFASDRFVQFAPENLGLALNAVDWLAQDEELIAIRSKDRQPVPLVFQSALERDLAKYANLIGLPLIVALLGLAHLVQRRRRTRDP